MIEHRLRQQLDKVADRLRRLWLWRGLAAAWLLAALAGVIVFGIGAATGWQPRHPVGWVGVVAVAAAAAAMILAWAAGRDDHALALRIEAAHPELRSCLLTAIEQRPELPLGHFRFLQEAVIRQALRHAYGHAWERIVPTRRIAAAMMANAAALVLLLFVLASLSSSTSARSAVAGRTGSDTAPAGGQLSVAIEPGDTEVEKGASLLVLARYTGDQPAGATLVFQSPGGEPARLSMAKSLDDPVFGGRIPTVEAPLDYHVQLDDYTSTTFHVRVFEYPRLVQADARLVYPEYTSLAERLIEDVRTVSAVEGTELTLICRLNKPVASATLTQKNGEPIVLAATDDESVYQATLPCDHSRRLQLQLVDAEGRRNKTPAEFIIDVLPNKPPDLKLAFPGHDIEVSPLEETDVKATAWDDFGLERFGLSFAITGQEPTEVVLGERAAAKERQELAHVIRLEELEAQPDQLLSYHFWAEDRDATGKTRRTLSDMYFAEVRRFDEIFRQGEQPPGGQQQQQGGSPNADAAQKLSQLQKDIINATWKLIRRETPGPPSPEYAGDAQTIQESQATALEQASELAQKLEDPKSQAYAGAVTQAMEEALKQLKAAHDGAALDPLVPALSAEQAAYQALLKLRANEHRVVRGQQGGGGGGGSGRSQQQLQQLELKNDENRYENQRTAQSQPQQDRETRQALNRLSELARRQSDLNERLKELQSALQEARTPEEREEIRRQLKRLRDEEQEILRDTDELRARLESPENQERMADARQQLDQTRDQVRRAAEALDDEKVSQAAAAGTRAERDFQELRNEFRRRASGRFDEEMKQMREQARELDDREGRIAERLGSSPDDAPAKSLRDDRPDEKLPGELAEQQQRLDELLERMRQTIDEAESTEPLLSQQLYDTARKAQEQDLARALEAAEISVERGLTDDAREQERLARAGIGQMREGIERAAESVLGDDAEALRRARDELNRLAEELNDEIARNSEQEPGSAGAREQGSTGEGERGRVGDAKTRSRGERGTARLGDAEREGRGDAETRRNGDAETRSAGAGQQTNVASSPPRPVAPSSPETSSPPNSPADPNTDSTSPSQSGGRGSERGGPRSLSGITGPGGPRSPDDQRRGFAPIAGEDFMDWSDRLRDVEEMVDDPELRAEAARIRQRARDIRVDLKRNFQAPRWDLVKMEVSDALVELRDRVVEELLRRTSKDAVLPLDRDPVPPKYLEKTRRYYERLGTGK
ncbi:MAG TPA: hypothetical protein VJ783_21535 [Pirellulales bacterium]|nr:hypothetical protein [Pirellulales bacterium]